MSALPLPAQKAAADLLTLEAATLQLGTRNFGPFTLGVRPGERIAILGPSGAGKSTLLKLMARDQPPAHGRVLFDQRALASWPLSELSLRRAVLPQASEVAFDLLTDLVIGLGRVTRRHDPQLQHIIQAAAAQARAEHLLGRRFTTLSGGEQARVQLARVFAQMWDVQAGLILVDEPLAALDPGLQFELLDSLDTFAAQRDHALIAILHDINHAMQGFDRLLLVKDGKLQSDMSSTPAAIPALESLYGIRLCCLAGPHGHLFVAPLPPSGRRAANA